MRNARRRVWCLLHGGHRGHPAFMGLYCRYCMAQIDVHKAWPPEAIEALRREFGKKEPNPDA